MKNKQLILLLASSFMLTGCGNKTNDSSSTEKDENQIAYEIISKAYDYLERYIGDFKRTNTFRMSEYDEALDTYEEEIIYDHNSKECLYQMNKNDDYLYQYFNKKDINSDSYKMYVNTSVENQKLVYKSTDGGFDYLMNIYDDPIKHTDYRDVLVYTDDFTSLNRLHDAVDVSNSNKHAFLKQAAYQNSLEYFKEYFTLLFSELAGSPNKINDLSSEFSYEKVDDLITIKFSGKSSTKFEATEETDEALIESGIGYVFTLDRESRFTNIERNISCNFLSYDKGHEVDAYYFDVTNTETFDYEIGDWALSEDVTGYTDTNAYPLCSMDVQLFSTCNGLVYSSTEILSNLKDDETIDFNYLDNVLRIIPNQYDTAYRKEGTKIEKVYFDPECTKEFTETNMKMGRLELYCTYDFKENVCIATERNITDISAYNYKFGNEILFEDRVSYSYEYNFIEFGEEQIMCFEESMFEVYSAPIGNIALVSVTIDGTTYDKEALVEGFSYNLSNRTVITRNYTLVNQ